MQTQRCRSCTSAGRMTSVLRYNEETFPPARRKLSPALRLSPAETILNNHRVIGIVTNTSVMLSCALVTYLMMTAEVGLPDAV